MLFTLWYTHCPRRSDVMSPASRSTFRWYEIVGWLRPNAGTMLHSHISFMCAIVVRIRMRVGSESALNAAVAFFVSSPGGAISATGQQSAFGDSITLMSVFMRVILEHYIDGCPYPTGIICYIVRDVTKEVPEILFVCVHNAGRSQMAAVLAHAMSDGRVHVRSAGTTPADEINPQVVAAMSELGLDLAHEFPKPLTDEAVRAADVVILMGCGDACPVYPGKRYLDWELEDPAGKPIETVRRIRDEIEEKVAGLLTELGVEQQKI